MVAKIPPKTRIRLNLSWDCAKYGLFFRISIMNYDKKHTKMQYNKQHTTNYNT